MFNPSSAGSKVRKNAGRSAVLPLTCHRSLLCSNHSQTHSHWGGNTKLRCMYVLFITHNTFWATYMNKSFLGFQSCKYELKETHKRDNNYQLWERKEAEKPHHTSSRHKRRRRSKNYRERGSRKYILWGWCAASLMFTDTCPVHTVTQQCKANKNVE